MATIEWVNHASFILEHCGTRLICDPWLDGPAFDQGWDLVSRTVFSYEAFRNITHVWFSHEHPDHFSPPTLAKIPSDARANITAYYQATRDQRVIHFCRQKGFANTSELYPGQWQSVGRDFSVLCEPHDNGDSWLAARIGDLMVLNLNDCVVTTAAECKRIGRKLGRIDILATQFSYANWVGNKDNVAAMRQAASEKLAWMKTQIVALSPKFVLPFASFVFFSHEDNCSLNQGMTTADEAVEFVKKETCAIPVVLYPGDRWALESSPPDQEAIRRLYTADYDATRRDTIRHRSESRPWPELLEHGNEFTDRLRNRNGILLRCLPTVHVFVEDHARALRLSGRGVVEDDRTRASCDLACKSDALDHAFRFDWGGRTLDINGRFQVPSGGSYWKFKTYATLANFNSRDEGLFTIVRTAWQRAKKRLVLRT